jgi:aminobenzoyl-glutamate utilization protein B
MKDYSKIAKEVDAIESKIWDVASNIWEFAEQGYHEVKSSAYASEALESEGFKITDRGIGTIDTSWIATWGNGSPVLGLMAEYDALPGLGNDTQPKKTPAKSGNTSGHGCGHNLICSTSVGAAIALKNHMEKENIKGTIKVVGTPAEELLNGKNYMAAAGAFKDMDVILHNHPTPKNSVWNFHSNAAMDMWIEFKGTAAHAGLQPWDGRSALHALEVFLTGVNAMREQMIPEARMHYQILSGGAAVNTIPDYTKVLIRYRGPNAENVRKHKEWIKDIAKGAALATQTESVFTNLGGIYDCLPNDVLAERVTDHLHKYFPLDFTEEEQAYAKGIQKEMGVAQDGMAADVSPVPYGVSIGASSDVGDVSWQKPTMGVIYSSWPLNVPAHTWGATACNGMSIGHKATVAAAKTMAATGLDLLTDPDFLQKAKDEFVKQLDGRTYKTLNDSDTNIQGKLDTKDQKLFDCSIHGAMEHFGMPDHHHDH